LRVSENEVAGDCRKLRSEVFVIRYCYNDQAKEVDMGGTSEMHVKFYLENLKT